MPNRDQLNKFCGCCLLNPFSSVKKRGYKAQKNSHKDKEGKVNQSIVNSQPTIAAKDSIDENLDQVVKNFSG